MTTEVSFDVSSEDEDLIRDIVEHGLALEQELGAEAVDRTALLMDFTAAHANGCPLRLADKLEPAQTGAIGFAQDWFGIQANLDRTTGKMLNHFLPRFARPEAPAQIDLDAELAKVEPTWRNA